MTDKETEKLVMQLHKEIVGALATVFDGYRDFYKATQGSPEIINALESASLLEVVRACHYEATTKEPNLCDRTFYATRDNPSSAFVDIWVNDKPTLEFYVDKNGKEKSCWLGDDDCLADSSVTVQECMALFGFCPGLEELVIFSVSTSAKQVKTEEDIEEERLEEDALMANLPPSYVFSTPNAVKGFYQTKSRDNNSEIRCVCGNVVGLRHIPKGSDEQVKRWFFEAQREFHETLKYKGSPKGCIECFSNGLRLLPITVRGNKT